MAGFRIEAYFCCPCFCTSPQPVFVFLAVHTLHHRSLPFCATLAIITLCCTPPTSWMRASEQQQCWRKQMQVQIITQLLLPAEFCTIRWSKAGPYIIERAALFQLSSFSENTLSLHYLKVLNYPLETLWFLLLTSFIILFFIYIFN